jgi:hypothetical protein
MKTFAVLLFAGVAGSGIVSAGSSSAEMTVGVTVVRSCAIDARPVEKSSSPLRLTCTAGAHSNVRLSEAVQRPTAQNVSSNDLQVVTLNF